MVMRPIPSRPACALPVAALRRPLTQGMAPPPSRARGRPRRPWAVARCWAPTAPPPHWAMGFPRGLSRAGGHARDARCVCMLFLHCGWSRLCGRVGAGGWLEEAHHVRSFGAPARSWVPIGLAWLQTRTRALPMLVAAAARCHGNTATGRARMVLPVAPCRRRWAASARQACHGWWWKGAGGRSVQYRAPWRLESGGSRALRLIDDASWPCASGRMQTTGSSTSVRWRPSDNRSGPWPTVSRDVCHSRCHG